MDAAPWCYKWDGMDGIGFDGLRVGWGANNTAASAAQSPELQKQTCFYVFQSFMIYNLPARHNAEATLGNARSNKVCGSGWGTDGILDSTIHGSNDLNEVVRGARET